MWIKSSIMCTKMLLLAGFACLLSAPQAARGSDMVHGTEQYAVDKDVGMTCAFDMDNSTVIVYHEADLNFSMDDKCPLVAWRYPHEQGMSMAETTRRSVAPDEAERCCGCVLTSLNLQSTKTAKAKLTVSWETGRGTGGPGLI